VKMKVMFLVIYFERTALPSSKLNYFSKKLESFKEIGYKMDFRELENQMRELLCYAFCYACVHELFGV
jgi:hypothetical protein